VSDPTVAGGPPRGHAGNDSGTSSGRAALLLALVLAASAALRLWHLDAGWFGVDQARDAAWAERISTGVDWPEAGPAMRNRVRLGATYHFFWAIPALFVDSPLAGYAFAALLGTAAVVGGSALAWQVAGPVAGLAAALWLGFHPVAVIDSRIAWAPAAVPAACALFLWVGRRFLRSPGRLNAALVGLASGFATQLHLATAALLPVAAGTLLARFGRVGRAGLAVAAAACAILLVPMAAAMRLPLALPSASPMAAASEVSPWRDRLLDFFFLVPRLLSGLTPPYPSLAWGARVWIPLELLATAAPVLAALWLARRTGEVREPSTLRLVLATFAATTLVPLLLPTEAWYYYFDGALVAGAIVVGVAVARAGSGRGILPALAGIAACRALLLAWWVAAAASSGEIPANLDYLRVGGPRPARLSARASLATVAAKRAMADAVLDVLGSADRPLRHDLHGVGADDVDGDNGYFLLRASRARGAAGEGTGQDALLMPPQSLPPSWIDGFPDPRRLRGRALFAYRSVLHPERGSLEGCATGEVPEPPRPDPLDYGAGEPRHTAWPCSEPIVRVPFDPSPDGITVRVFPRVVGAGSVRIESVDPPVEVLRPGIPPLGPGVVLPRSGGELRLRVLAKGPATLDLVELHGRSGPIAPTPPSEPPTSPADEAPQVSGRGRDPRSARAAAAVTDEG